MVIVILLLLGLCLGSFANAFVWRFHEQSELRRGGHKGGGEPLKPAPAHRTEKARGAAPGALTAEQLSISRGRSMCVHCHHELAARDLIPVVSYVLLRGRCRYCGKPIQDTPLAELLTPLLFVVSYLWWPFGFSQGGLVVFCLWLVFLTGFVILTLYDLRWFELPHLIVLPLIGLAAAQAMIVPLVLHSDAGAGGIEAALAGGVIGGGVFGLIYLLSPKMTFEDGSRGSAWIGEGDITLGTLLGLLVGGPVQALLLIFVASALGTLVALPLLATGRAKGTTHLPFGPFLMAAAVIVLLFGTALVDWYAQLLL